MEGLASVHDLQALSALLSPNHEDEEEDLQQVKPMARMGPGHISEKKSKEGSTAYVKKNSKNIWDEDEVTEGAHFDDLNDPQPQPEYEIVLKQSVGTEDLFLGLSRKDPSSMCLHKQEGNARFIVEREELEITLPMNRPMDCIHLT
ncbi:dynein axonemal assembly factor 6 [Sinocyclocheilus grahami]|uniref:dynein axonemal assembly factor 6 n=1 Tax=Sinocyclocheilus grahami TaxID=75366 RepID=UPI0007AC703F|nr:PREDICTED: protein PIH1D3-like [Sinocyclocheilus grahami]